MSRRYPAITFTPSVRHAQERYGARENGLRLESSAADDERLSERERSFIAQRDGFYMATVGEGGWPYLQFRGGPVGFLRSLDEGRLAYADYRGNRQYISVGNLVADDRVSLFFMDYARQRRLKVLARAEVFEAAEQPELLREVHDDSYPATPERVIVFHVEAFDWNCAQHITPRYTEAEWAARAAGPG